VKILTHKIIDTKFRVSHFQLPQLLWLPVLTITVPSYLHFTLIFLVTLCTETAAH